jgi:hypothetical protein
VSSFAILATVPEEEFFQMPEEQVGNLDVMFGAVGIGPVEAAEQATLPLREWSQGAVDIGGRLSYVDAQQFFRHEYEGSGYRHYWCSVYLDELTDEAIDTLTAFHPLRPSEFTTISLWHLGGAVARGPQAESAVGRRDAKYMLCIEGNWSDPAADEQNIDFCRKFHEAMRSFGRGENPNYPGAFERGTAATRATFGDAAFRRLIDVKQKYDPDNLFALTHVPLLDQKGSM